MLNRGEKILLYGSNLWSFGEGMFAPLFAIFAQRVGGNILDISWAWALYLIFTGLFIIVIGNLSDSSFSFFKKSIHHKELIIFGYGLYAILTFCYLFVHSPFQLAIVQIGLGLASAITVPSWNALYARYHRKHESASRWGLASGQANIVTGIAIFIGGLIVAYFSFTTLFIVMGCIQVLTTLSQLYLLKK
jgi:MFS family permease